MIYYSFNFFKNERKIVLFVRIKKDNTRYPYEKPNVIQMAPPAGLEQKGERKQTP